MRTPQLHALPVLAVAILLGAVVVLSGHRAAPPIAVAAQNNFAGLIDIDNGRRLYLECRGAGSPTVVLEAGYRSSARAWSEDFRQLGAPRMMVLAGVTAFTRWSGRSVMAMCCDVASTHATPWIVRALGNRSSAPWLPGAGGKPRPTELDMRWVGTLGHGNAPRCGGAGRVQLQVPIQPRARVGVSTIRRYWLSPNSANAWPLQGRISCASMPHKPKIAS
jgi:hypothetical protein